jgi:hypothetical protein
MRIKLMAAVTLFSALAAGLWAGAAYAAGGVEEASRPRGEPLCARCGSMDAVASLGRQYTPTRAVFTRYLPNVRAERGVVSVHERQLAKLVKSDRVLVLKEAAARRHPRVIPLGGDVLDQSMDKDLLLPGALEAAHDLQQTALGASELQHELGAAVLGGHEVGVQHLANRSTSFGVKLLHQNIRFRTEQLTERHFHPRPAPGNPM